MMAVRRVPRPELARLVTVTVLTAAVTAAVRCARAWALPEGMAAIAAHAAMQAAPPRRTVREFIWAVPNARELTREMSDVKEYGPPGITIQLRASKHAGRVPYYHEMICLAWINLNAPGKE